MSLEVKRGLAAALKPRQPFLAHPKVRAEVQHGLAFIWVHFCFEHGVSPWRVTGHLREQICLDWLRAVDRLQVLSAPTAQRWIPAVEELAMAVWNEQLAAGPGLSQGDLPLDHPGRSGEAE